MKRLEANLMLLSVSFFWGIQYIFIKDAGEEISTFAFLTVTYGLGFLLLALPFRHKLKTLTRWECRQSLILAALLVGFNTFLFAGLQLLEASFVSFAVNAAYLVFILVFTFLLHGLITLNHCLGVLFVIGGLALITGNLTGFASWLGLAEVTAAAALFAMHVIYVDRITKHADLLALSLGQMLFCTLCSLVAWVALAPETLAPLNLSAAGWFSVLMIAVFIRGYTTVAQLYAQRFVLPVDASLILSLEIVFTLTMSTFLPALLGNHPEELSLQKVMGCCVILTGLIVSSCGLSAAGTTDKGAANA